MGQCSGSGCDRAHVLLTSCQRCQGLHSTSLPLSSPLGSPGRAPLTGRQTRVGEGIFKSEDVGEVGHKLQQIGREWGVSTGRKRRCGWLDLVVLKYSASVNYYTAWNLTSMSLRRKAASYWRDKNKTLTLLQSSTSSILSRFSRSPSPTRTPIPARSSTTSRPTSGTSRGARLSTRSLRAGSHQQRPSRRLRTCLGRRRRTSGSSRSTRVCL